MTRLDELKMEIESRYDDYLYMTEHRGISYGEIAYIRGLTEKELEDFSEDLEEAINRGD